MIGGGTPATEGQPERRFQMITPRELQYSTDIHVDEISDGSDRRPNRQSTETRIVPQPHHSRCAPSDQRVPSDTRAVQRPHHSGHAPSGLRSYGGAHNQGRLSTLKQRLGIRLSDEDLRMLILEAQREENRVEEWPREHGRAPSLQGRDRDPEPLQILYPGEDFPEEGHATHDRRKKKREGKR